MSDNMLACKRSSPIPELASPSTRNHRLSAEMLWRGLIWDLLSIVNKVATVAEQNKRKQFKKTGYGN